MYIYLFIYIYIYIHSIYIDNNLYHVPERILYYMSRYRLYLFTKWVNANTAFN